MEPGNKFSVRNVEISREKLFKVGLHRILPKMAPIKLPRLDQGASKVNFFFRGLCICITYCTYRRVLFHRIYTQVRRYFLSLDGI